MIGKPKKGCLGAIMVLTKDGSMMVQLDPGRAPNAEQEQALKAAEDAFVRFARASKEEPNA